MRSLKSGLVTIALSGGLGLAAVVGCSADGGLEITDPTQNTNPTEGEGNTVVPPGSGTPDPGTPDAGKKDAGKDAGKKPDAAVDAGPPPPEPGTACTTVDQVATKKCGKCGEAAALCQSDKTWSVYGACEAETGECNPGETAACGNCGTKTCDQFCGWGACMGEPANSCSPGTSEQSTVGCPPQGTVKPYRTRSCKTDCTWESFSASCVVPPSFAPIPIELKASPTVLKVSTGACPTSVSTFATATPYVYTQVTNPAAFPVRVVIWHSKAPDGPTALDTIMAVYDGAAAPATDDARKACIGTVSDFGDTTLTQADADDFASVKDITIPANGTITVYSAGYLAGTTGKLLLNVKAQ
jgi:hypothetical protein